jgi:polar amino acid transport system substrate-binding protein
VQKSRRSRFSSRPSRQIAAAWGVGILAACISSAVARADQAILELLYHERAPYYVVGADGNVGGLAGDPVGHALRSSGLAYRWVSMAANAQLKAIQEATAPVCALGWFKTPAREEFAKFTSPIYRDRPQVLLLRNGDRRVLRHRTVDEIFSDPGLRLGAKLGYSYGAKIDADIERLKPVQVTTSQDMVGMLRMLAGERFDYFLSSAEEAPIIIAGFPEAGGKIVTHELNDMPQGNERYLLCSRNTPDQLIERFNAAIGDSAR